MPNVTFSGAAFNRNEGGTFDVNAAQYTSFYKNQCHLSTLPICAHFDEVRYKKKKPVLSNNTYVAVEGTLLHVDVNAGTGSPSLFHITVDSINFLGRATLPTSHMTDTQSMYCVFTSHSPN